MMRHTRVTAMVAVLLVLTACGPTGGGPTPTESATPSTDPTSTPSDEPVAQPSVVIVDGDSVSVNASDGGIIIDIPFTTDPTTAVTQLSETIGLDVTVSTLPSTACFKERQAATWGGLSFIWGEDWQRAPGALFIASVNSAESASGIKTTLPSGHWVGASGPAVIAANAAAPLDDFGAWISLYYDVVSGTPGGDPDTFFGAYALIDDDGLTSFASPIRYNYDC